MGWRAREWQDRHARAVATGWSEWQDTLLVTEPGPILPNQVRCPVEESKVRFGLHLNLADIRIECARSDRIFGAV